MKRLVALLAIAVCAACGGETKTVVRTEVKTETATATPSAPLRISGYGQSSADIAAKLNTCASTKKFSDTVLRCVLDQRQLLHDLHLR